MKTGFEELDKIIDLDLSKFILISARPGMGKTSFISNICNYIIKNDNAVLYFSLESSKDNLLNRILCEEVEVTLEQLESNLLSKEKLLKVNDSRVALMNSKLFIDNECSSIEEITEKSIEAKKMHDIKFIVIDYLQLLDKNVNDENTLAKMLLNLSKKLNITIVVLAQLNRKVENRNNHIPQIFDIEEELVKIFDNIIFIYRDEYYNTCTEKRNIADIIVIDKMKNHNKFNLRFKEENFKFENIKIED